MDGEVIIDVNADESKFDKKMDKLEQKLKNEKLDLEIKTANVEDAKRELQEVVQQLEIIKKKRDEINLTYQSKKNQYDILNAKIDKGEHLTQEEYNRHSHLNNVISSLKSEMKEVNIEYDKMNKKINKANDKLTNATIKQKQRKQKIIETNKEIVRLNNEEKKSQINNIKDAMKKFGQETKQTVKQVAKWALAIFGVRSAYLMIRKATSTISQYDEQVKSDLQYIQVALASVLEPVIKTIIGLVYKLLQYLQYIVFMWTGKNIFANANKALNKMTGSAKELKKQLAGFDEMNVLSDSNSNGGGAVAPSMDLSKIDKAINFNDILEKGKMIAEEFIEKINNFFKNTDWKQIAKNISSAIIEVLNSLADLIAQVDWQAIGKAIGDFILNFDWIGLLVSIFKLLVTGFEATADIIIGFIDSLIEFFEDPECVDKMIKAGGDLILGLFEGMIRLVFKIGEVIAKIIELVLKLFGIHSPSKVFSEIGVKLIEGLINGIKETIQKVIDVFVWLIDKIKTTFINITNWIKTNVIIPIGNFFSNMWNKISNEVINVYNKIKNTFNSIVNFFKGIINSVVNLSKDLGTKVGDVIGGTFKGVINGVLKAIENILNTPIKAINGLISVINKVPGINLGKLSTFKLPRLAKGTILNAPGKGVPVAGGSAIAGEAGREAYLPLSDAQLLEELGSTIGKYININATIPVYMGNRQVAREFRKISAEDDFAYNR